VTAAAGHHAATTAHNNTKEVLLIVSGLCVTVSAGCCAKVFPQSADGPDHAYHREFCVTCQSCMSSHQSCVQVTPDQLMTALTTRAIETMGERIVKNLDAAAASVSRDALAKNLYAKLFDWLVAAINRKISAIGKHAYEADTKSKLLLGGFGETVKDSSFCDMITLSGVCLAPTAGHGFRLACRTDLAWPLHSAVIVLTNLPIYNVLLHDSKSLKHGVYVITCCLCYCAICVSHLAGQRDNADCTLYRKSASHPVYMFITCNAFMDGALHQLCICTCQQFGCLLLQVLVSALSVPLAYWISMALRASRRTALSSCASTWPMSGCSSSSTSTSSRESRYAMQSCMPACHMHCNGAFPLRLCCM